MQKEFKMIAKKENNTPLIGLGDLIVFKAQKRVEDQVRVEEIVMHRFFRPLIFCATFQTKGIGIVTCVKYYMDRVINSIDIQFKWVVSPSLTGRTYSYGKNDISSNLTNDHILHFFISYLSEDIEKGTVEVIKCQRNK